MEDFGTELKKKGIEKMLDVAADYTNTLLKPSLEQIGGLLSDTLKGYRLRNQANILTKTKLHLESKGISSKNIQLDFFLPLLEAGSYVNDERLSDMFASLLASHADEATKDQTHIAFVEILKNLSPLDALVFTTAVDIQRKVETEKGFPTGLPCPYGFLEEAVSVLTYTKLIQHKFELSTVQLSLVNLERLALIDFTGEHPSKPLKDTFQFEIEKNNLGMNSVISDNLTPKEFESMFHLIVERNLKKINNTEWGQLFYDKCTE